MASNKKTPIEFAREWYTYEGIFAAIRQSNDIPQITSTCEFAAWLTDQYRLAFTKGMQIARDDMMQSLRTLYSRYQDARDERDAMKKSNERSREQLEEAQLLAREFYQHVGSMVQRTPETHCKYLEQYPWLGRRRVSDDM